MTMAVRMENVSKRYRLGSGVVRLRDAFAGAPARAGLEQARPDILEAVKDLSFEVAQGETLGIIGHNGAGKSTALRMLSGVTRPSAGRIFCRGRVSALIELGAGFHPELTGRENVYLNGSILGLKRGEIARLFDEIVAFAELEPFIDTPVKRYSSGMYVRLGFAVAAHTHPDILLVDEVLSVGDQAFQAKCLNRIGQMQRAGLTAVLVSHNMVVVRRHCSRVMLLDHGCLIANGSPEEMLRLYQQRTFSGDFGARQPVSGMRSVTHRVRIDGLQILDTHGAAATRIRSDDQLRLVVSYHADEEVTDPVFEVVLQSQNLGGIFTRIDNKMFGQSVGKLGPGSGTLEVVLDCVPLKNDMVQASVAIFSFDYRELFDWKQEMGAFVVESADAGEGTVFVKPDWRLLAADTPSESGAPALSNTAKTQRT